MHYPNQLKIPFWSRNNATRIITKSGIGFEVDKIIITEEAMSKTLITFNLVEKTTPLASKNNPRSKIKFAGIKPQIPNSQKHAATKMSNIPNILIIMIYGISGCF